MHRVNLLKLIEKYKPSDLLEKEYKIEIIDFIKNNKDCFERSCKIGHITGSIWLVNFDNSKFLLTLHKKFKTWLQLGGHSDGNSNIIDVAIKEAHEESGLENIELIHDNIFDISIHKIDEYNNVPSHIHYDIRFIVRSTDINEKIKISDESIDLKWFETPPLDNNTDINRMFNKWKSL